MSKFLDPFRLLLISLAGWMNQRQLNAIKYLREENRIYREQLGGKRLPLNGNQRRRLAAKAKGLGRTIRGSKSIRTGSGVKPFTFGPLKHWRPTRADTREAGT